jgi:RHS repeat-associated protein
VEAQRLSREKNLGTTFYGWDGDTLAWETTNEESTHYFYEPDSFVPLAQGVQNHAIQLHPTPDWTDREYSLKEDPLWTQVLEPTPFDKLGFYHCDHLGTPQEMTDEEGNIAWSAQYKAWGEAKEIISKAAKGAGFKNPLRFQGQYFDHETGLHYNRFRFYDPETGRFINKDPIGFGGGFNAFQYAPNPIGWFDRLGLKKGKICPCSDPCGIAPHGSQSSPRLSGHQSHHIIQDAWVKDNFPSDYKKEGMHRKAPAIILPQIPAHKIISDRQNVRIDQRLANGQPKWGTTMREEFDNAYRDLGAAGVSEKCRRKAIKKAYNYFYNE